MLHAGDKFPDFQLPDQSGHIHSLERYAGQWLVMYFYPKDNTSGCTSEALDFAELHPRFAALGAVVMGISPDGVDSHRKFALKYGLPFTLLADPEHSLLEACAVWRKKSMYGREYMGVARTTMLVNPQGVVAEIWNKVKVKGHAAAALARLEALKGQ